MPEPKNDKLLRPDDAEQRSLGHVALTIAASGTAGALGGAANAYVSHHLNKPKDPPKDK